MQTIGYVFVLVALLVFRSVSKGRGLSSIPGDLSDAFIALVDNDPQALKAALNRTGDNNVTSTNSISVAGLPTSGDGAALLAEAKALGSKASGYRLGRTGPDYYDCSALVWRAAKTLGIYTGPRFTTATFPAIAGKFTVRVTDPATGDIVWWPGHMGIVDGEGTFYSALNRRSGIKTIPISGIHRGAPRYYRVRTTKIGAGTGSANAAEHGL